MKKSLEIEAVQLKKWLLSWYHRLASPRWFYHTTEKWLPWLAVITTIILVVGAVWGLAFAPVDYKQGNSYRIIFIHVPACAIAMAGYMTMATAAGISLVWKIKLAEVIMKSCAPIGAGITLIALVSGSLWGKPTWGTYWVWDARLTSALLLWMTMIGYLLVRKYGGAGSERLASGLGGFAMVNIPLVYMSTKLFNTNHPGTNTVPSLDPSMRAALWLSVLLFTVFFVLLLRLRVDSRRAERRLYQCREMALDAGLFE